MNSWKYLKSYKQEKCTQHPKYDAKRVAGVTLDCCRNPTCLEPALESLGKLCDKMCSENSTLQQQLDEIIMEKNRELQEKDRMIEELRKELQESRKISITNNYTVNVNFVDTIRGAKDDMEVYRNYFQKVLLMSDSEKKKELVDFFHSSEKEKHLAFRVLALNDIQEDVLKEHSEDQPLLLENIQRARNTIEQLYLSN